MFFGTKISTKLLLCAIVATVSACGGGGGDNADHHNVVTPPPAKFEPTLSTKPIVLSSATVLGTPFWPNGSTATGGKGSPIDSVNCLVTEEYHIHAHLTIIRNGEILALPKDIGLTGCAYELHSHDHSGVLHVETAAYRKFTLGQFFSVWGQSLTPTNIAGITGLPVAVYINDGTSLVEYKGDLAALELTQHRAITIQLGTPVREIPSFAWEGGL